MGENIFGKCLFCPIGEIDKRKVIERTIQVPPIVGYEDRGPSEMKEYYCGLGDIGKDCVVPKMAQLGYRGFMLGSREFPERIG